MFGGCYTLWGTEVCSYDKCLGLLSCGVQVCSDDKCLGVGTHCGVQVCSDDKCLGLLHFVGCKCVQRFRRNLMPQCARW